MARLVSRRTWFTWPAGRPCGPSLGVKHRPKASPLYRAACAVLAALGCVWMGVSRGAAMSRRARSLRAWARVVCRMEAGLAYSAHTLEELLRGALGGEENREVSARIAVFASRMEANPMLPLREAVKGVPMPELTSADRAALSPLWQGLGTGDIKTQRGLLQSVRAALDAQITEAAEKEKKDRRLAVTLGFITGAAVFLFLI